MARHAVALMREALDLLDAAEATEVACHLSLALDIAEEQGLGGDSSESPARHNLKD
ncbi:hypothetical protein [Flavisphingomonas formosensis]|uniref:hypothetical protein n=1 Tax=Flavisphingomonas formosensis TaxID=861534 RepID=UPI0012F8E4E7|nr:hypothetical protein [Sphingomonas formosensis]